MSARLPVPAAIFERACGPPMTLSLSCSLTLVVQRHSIALVKVSLQSYLTTPYLATANSCHRMKFVLSKHPFWDPSWRTCFSSWACASSWEAYAFASR